MKLLKIYLLIVVQVLSYQDGNALCPRTLMEPLNGYSILANGSFYHEGSLYDLDVLLLHNDTISCPCETSLCVRKCCPVDQVSIIRENRAECVSMNRPIPALRLKDQEMAPELHGISNLSQVFHIIQNRYCPYGSIQLHPERFIEDKFVLQINGSISTVSDKIQNSKYCMDWEENLNNITVFVCAELGATAVVVEPLFPLGMITSVPFLVATFLVYAIIPELRNIYGRTLMCYVASLISAYCFLVVAKLSLHTADNFCVPFASSDQMLCDILITYHKKKDFYSDNQTKMEI
ncbi:G-protein coupled receptor Mth2-like [Cephus cinctus]|uniref:G-protein coupled receptor Mth2-like n=1 Tax=Cephus cinctus TaxID=211228 RepID=A0AAJ7BVP7_CEPCN|nr:G-protein coupled receptor Mth2-like [Cephus cinctus]